MGLIKYNTLPSDRDKALWAWGRSDGEPAGPVIGPPTDDQTPVPRIILRAPISQLACGAYHAAVLLHHGQVLW